MTIVFDKSRGDTAYRAWLDAHQDGRVGYVLNTQQNPTPRYMWLHKSTCWTISGYRNPTENAYAKVCAETIEELRAWVREHGRPDGSFSGECGHCKPTAVPIPGGGGQSRDAQGQTRKPGSHRDNTGHN
jgi:hypothetical protein